MAGVAAPRRRRDLVPLTLRRRAGPVRPAPRAIGGVALLHHDKAGLARDGRGTADVIGQQVVDGVAADIKPSALNRSAGVRVAVNQSTSPSARAVLARNPDS